MKKILLSTLLTALLLINAGTVHAYATPYAINHVEDYLNDAAYFNGWVSISAQDFSGLWEYTAIASEAGNQNNAESPVYSAGWSGSSNVFSNADTSNWGIFEQIDFNTGNIYFEDVNGPYNVPLDPFSSSMSGFFRMYRLTAASELLSYLTNPIVLAAGTIIVGYNDNNYPPSQDGGDSDFDDLVIALNPIVETPEPGMIVLFLLGIGLVVLSVRQRHQQEIIE